MIKSSKESDYGRSIQAGLSHTEWQALPFTAPQLCRLLYLNSIKRLYLPWVDSRESPEH